MRDLDRALADIVAIRAQIERGAALCGPGSATLAATGVIALAVTLGQATWFAGSPIDAMPFFVSWIVAAVLALTLVTVETVRRSRPLRLGLADAAVIDALEAVLPAVGAGACLGLVVMRFAPAELWMLPGLWQILTGLGLFAAVGSLPRAVRYAAAWYLVAGLASLAWASGPQTLSPWVMGLPFALGQGLLALIMHHAMEGEMEGDDAVR